MKGCPPESYNCSPEACMRSEECMQEMFRKRKEKENGTFENECTEEVCYQDSEACSCLREFPLSEEQKEELIELLKED